MRLKRICLLLLAAFVLGGCVTSKTPVGDKVAVLKPEEWNAKWRGSDGSVIRTRIKDAKLGIVEVKEIKPWWKQKRGEPETMDLLIRTLGAAVIANSRQDAKDFYQFQRVSISDTHLITFDGNEIVFEDLIRRHEIPGRIEKNKNAIISNSCAIDRFSERDYQRLEKEGFAVQSLFNEDPTMVYIRYHGWW